MFETSLIDLEPKKKSRRALILPVALGIHCVALASVTFASYWNVSAIGEPPINAVFVSLVPPPPPLIRRGTDAPKPKREAVVQEQKQPEVKPAGPVQPDLEKIPEKVADSASVSDATSDLTGPGDPNGDPDGPEDGVTWGVEKSIGPVDSPTLVPVDGPSGPSVTMSDQPIHFKVGMTRPALTYQVQPRYTEAARKAGVQGAVTVEAVIDEQGRVTGVKLLHGLPMGLDQEAMAAVRQWRFTPATLQGKPVKIYFSLTVNFRIQR